MARAPNDMMEDTVELDTVLWRTVVPFSLTWTSDGQLSDISPLAARVWKLDGVPVAQTGDICLSRPFKGRLSPSQMPELTEVALHLHRKDLPGRTLRGQIFAHAGGWLFTGFPAISTIEQLDDLGLRLSDLPLHARLGELLIANEASAASLREAQEQSHRLIASNQELTALNHRFERFVPLRFLEDIGADSALDVELGQTVEAEKAVMFADLRQFTTFAQQVGANRIFEIINTYLQSTAPCIEAHGGYVVQYLGDGIMALFPHGSPDALHAAVAMQQALKDTAATLGDLSSPLRMSIAIHSGPVALGVVGDEARWDVSIIADAVNTCARMESMTRMLGGEILASADYVSSLAEPEAFLLRSLGNHDIRGRTGSLALVEVLDSLDPDVLLQRRASREDFALGLDASARMDCYEAMSHFSRVLARTPDDLAAQYFLARISERLNAQVY